MLPRTACEAEFIAYRSQRPMSRFWFPVWPLQIQQWGGREGYKGEGAAAEEVTQSGAA